MAKTSTATEVIQKGFLRGSLEAAIRERVREITELVLEEEVEAAQGSQRSQRVATRAGYRRGWKGGFYKRGCQEKTLPPLQSTATAIYWKGAPFYNAWRTCSHLSGDDDSRLRGVASRSVARCLGSDA